MIFLMGAARCDGRDLVVEQLFLSDFPGEPEFLLAVRDLFQPYAAFVSYNGKTFDSHLLATRFLMNRIDFQTGPQVDLLHPARRLWRSITGDCSLKAIERGILGFTRELDVASEDIPLIWLSFLRSGKPGLLPAVFEHNVMDITSLARMYRVIGELLEGELGSTPVDRKALGCWLLLRDSLAGERVLEQTFHEGDAQAGAALGFHYKRRGQWDRAVEIWETLLSESRSVFAAVELAKHHEHRSRDPQRALSMVELIASWNLPMDQRTREALTRRRTRLMEKQTRR